MPPGECIKRVAEAEDGVVSEAAVDGKERVVVVAGAQADGDLDEFGQHLHTVLEHGLVEDHLDNPEGDLVKQTNAPDDSVLVSLLQTCSPR